MSNSITICDKKRRIECLRDVTVQMLEGHTGVYFLYLEFIKGKQG